MVQKPLLPVRACKLPRLMWGGIRPRTEFSGSSDLPFTMLPCLHHSNLYLKRKLRVWRVQKCIPLVSAKTALTCAGLQTTPSHVRQYWAEKGNLRKFGSTFRHGRMLAPKQCLYQKEAAGMESPKMYSSGRYKNRTYLCGPATYHVSWGGIGSRTEISGSSDIPSPLYHVCTKAMFISKGSCWYGESKNVFL